DAHRPAAVPRRHGAQPAARPPGPGAAAGDAVPQRRAAGRPRRPRRPARQGPRGPLPDPRGPLGGAARPGDRRHRRPAPRPPPTPPAARDQVAAWLNANHGLPAHSTIAEDHGRQIDARVPTGRAFIITLGPQLVKSGRPTILAGRRNDFFAFELPAGPSVRPL